MADESASALTSGTLCIPIFEENTVLQYNVDGNTRTLESLLSPFYASASCWPRQSTALFKGRSLWMGFHQIIRCPQPQPEIQTPESLILCLPPGATESTPRTRAVWSDPERPLARSLSRCFYKQFIQIRVSFHSNLVLSVLQSLCLALSCILVPFRQRSL